MDTVWQRDSSKLEEARDRVRKLVNRGNAAGAIASLTLFGSQQLGGHDPHEREFVTLCFFIAGLGSLLTRELVVVWHLHCKGERMYVRCRMSGMRSTRPQLS